MCRSILTRLSLFLAIIAGLAMLTGAGEKPGPATSDATPATAPITPKPLSAEVKKGLSYLVNQQQPNGGWGQGGGWRSSNGGGRVEGANVADPPDVASTCVAALALFRAGNTPREGPYAKNVARAVEFICSHIDKADKDSLYVTDIRDTQVQVKIGPFVDTFLSSLVLAELKGKMPSEDAEKHLVASLNKTIAKIENNQKKDGTFAGNTGWASVFSQGLCSKALNRAYQKGAPVKEETLARAGDSAAVSLGPVGGDDSARFASSGRAGLGAGGGIRLSASAAAPALASSPYAGPAAGAPSDAGVPIYKSSNGLAILQEAAQSNKLQEKEAREVLARKTATPGQKAKARADLDRFGMVEKDRDRVLSETVRQLDNKQFIQGFGSNGGEEFLSYLNISESLVAKGGPEWQKWDRSVTENLNRVQNQDGSWSGNHCITGRTFCTAGALLVMLADRTLTPVAAKMKSGR
jgi:hypothetical protein